MDKFNTHKFLYNLYHEGNIEGHKIIYIDKDNSQKEIDVKSIDIGPSPISCKVYDTSGNKHRIIFLRVKEIYYRGELVWENTDMNLDDLKVIKGYNKNRNE